MGLHCSIHCRLYCMCIALQQNCRLYCALHCSIHWSLHCAVYTAQPHCKICTTQPTMCSLHSEAYTPSLPCTYAINRHRKLSGQCRITYSCAAQCLHLYRYFLHDFRSSPRLHQILSCRTYIQIFIGPERASSAHYKGSLMLEDRCIVTNLHILGLS